MFQKLFATRLVPIGLCGAAILLTAAPARSERLGDERACVMAFKKAKEHEQSGKLQEAKDKLMSCAQAPCGSFVRQQCSSKYNQLEADTPSVVLIVTDPSGAPRADVQVRMDGQMFSNQLDGRALTVDPGMHEFTFSTDGSVFATQKIMIVQGQRNRFVTAVRAGGRQRHMVAQMEKPEAGEPARNGSARAPSRAEEVPVAVAPITDGSSNDADSSRTDQDGPKKHGSVLPYLVGGFGVASLGGAALLTYWGRKDNDKLGDCAPNCASASVSHIKSLYLASNVALGVGVAALGAAYWVYVVTHSSKEEKSNEQALRLDVAPTNSGGFASVSGSF